MPSRRRRRRARNERPGMRLRRCLAVLVAGLAASGPAAAHPEGSPARLCRSPVGRRTHAGPAVIASTPVTRSRRSRGAVTRRSSIGGANSLDPAAVCLPGSCSSFRSRIRRLRATPTAAVGAESTVVAALDRAVEVPGVSQARTGVVVVDLGSNSVIYALNPDAPLEPASTEKLPVAATALSGSVAAPDQNPRPRVRGR